MKIPVIHQILSHNNFPILPHFIKSRGKIESESAGRRSTCGSPNSKNHISSMFFVIEELLGKLITVFLGLLNERLSIRTNNRPTLSKIV